VEVDFPEVTTRKARIIRRTPALSALVGPPVEAAGGVSGELESVRAGRGRVSGRTYRLVPCDLSDVAGLERALSAAGVDRTLPTLLLSECVMVYMRPEDSSALVAWASQFFRGPAAFCTYEQILPDDAFGRVMLANLEARGCSLRGIRAFPTIAAQRARYLSRGWSACRAADMNAVFAALAEADPEALRRACRLEIFDEFEEWRLIQGHYLMLLATKPAEASLPGEALEDALDFLRGAGEDQ
jgi:tRNA wybutosine-synthesizing protein 4